MIETWHFRSRVMLAILLVCGFAVCLAVGAQFISYLSDRNDLGLGEHPTSIGRAEGSFGAIRALPAQTPILNFRIKPASEIGNRLQDDDLVIGVRLGGDARAYPVNMLTGPQREILNDTLNGQPIAATW